MEALTIHPQNSEQLAALEVILKAFKIPFERKSEESPYDKDFVKMIKESEKQVEEGKVTTMKIEDLWK